MSEKEFENWLSLLVGLLKLSPDQRDNISDELRSHLEERMEDLLGNGSSREEAIAAALEDFGDTASLAHHFTTIAHHTRRRRLMRYTYGTIAALTCSILVLASFWPGPQPPMMSQGVAQTEDPKPDNDPFGVPSVSTPSESVPITKRKPQIRKMCSSDETPFQGSKERIEAKLSQPLPEMVFIEVPFDQVLFELSDRLGVTFYIDPVALDQLGLAAEQLSEELITLEFPENAISTKTLLEYAIKSLGAGNDWGYTIRDNIVAITVKEDTFETVIYKCRDLIYPQNAAGRMGAASDPFGAMELDEEGVMSVQFGGGGGSMGGGEGYGMEGGMGGMGGGFSSYPQSPEQKLIEVITSTIDQESWSRTNPEEGIGSITSINGLLVIKHTREVQDQVKDLLQKLRDAMEE